MRLIYAFVALAIVLAGVPSIIGDGQASASSPPAAVTTAAHHKCHHHKRHCTHRHPCVNPGGPIILL